jgi:hypothetical protein
VVHKDGKQIAAFSTEEEAMDFCDKLSADEDNANKG